MKFQDIQELDIVRLRVFLRSEGLEKGMTGRVVMVYGTPPKDADVEFIEAETGKIKLVLVPLRWIERVDEDTNT